MLDRKLTGRDKIYHILSNDGAEWLHATCYFVGFFANV